MATTKHLPLRRNLDAEPTGHSRVGCGAVCNNCGRHGCNIRSEAAVFATAKYVCVSY